ncbi:gamma carbonic anhydrase family protein [Desulfurispira natronophila]|uniref:Carbonic anhydrase/acetyltransferase-like protein (Isoleucine patch superfamily) n=1 Tax=Desulfurispira natronophila TaxID=682562 RepID=A0A7W8DFW2_9BACT|nr:gamma carbonic anhydrase family protein [Desulfurispira natronophila]MBB5020745.1 carbonic anhydrase/acetyltransferase-like protein (isoleucine patch superfamily) [Desulfurispira natronophila]
MNTAFVRPYCGTAPRIEATSLVTPTAAVIGDVELAEDSSVWFCAVLRGDVNYIRVGRRSNIQDGSVVHVNGNPSFPTIIGDDVTVGHNVTLHGCIIGSRVLIGMGAVLLNGVTVGDDCIIGAGAVLRQGMEIPPGSLVVGNPAIVKRELAQQERDFLLTSASTYVNLARDYL